MQMHVQTVHAHFVLEDIAPRTSFAVPRSCICRLLSPVFDAAVANALSAPGREHPVGYAGALFALQVPQSDKPPTLTAGHPTSA